MFVRSKTSFKILLTAVLACTPLTVSAAPKWKKVNVNAGSSGGSGGSGGGAVSFSCVSVLVGEKVIPANLSNKLAGVVVNYIMVGGGGGGGASTVGGQNGKLASGSFTVANLSYSFYVGGGGGAGGNGGGGGSSGIVASNGVIDFAAGGDGANCVGSGASNTSGLSCGGSYNGGGGRGYFTGGGRNVGMQTPGVDTSTGVIATYRYGGYGAGYGGGGGGPGYGATIGHPAGGFNGNDGEPGVGVGGKGANTWVNQTLPTLHGSAGLGGGQNSGGNSGAIVLSYQAPSCLF